MRESQLITKLAKIMGEVGVVKKGGFNDFHKYEYVEERHVLEEVRGKLAAEGIMLLPSVTALTEREVTSAKGKVSTVTTLHVQFRFVDAESHEDVALDWVGQGDDAGDKGVNKAATSALKYFLLKTFLIPTGEPDPEGDRQIDERATERAPAPPRPSADETEVEQLFHERAKVEAPPETTEPIGEKDAEDLLSFLQDEVGVDLNRIRLAATHVAGEDIGDCDTPEQAAKSLAKLTNEQRYRLIAWGQKKAGDKVGA